MAQYEGSQLQRWVEQSEQPAAPTGLRKLAEDRASGGYEGSLLQQWVEEQGPGYRAESRRWFTGANTEGQQMGWDSDFMRRAIDQNRKFAERGLLARQFEQDNATGIVTWDHESSDGTRVFRFGDVFDEGRKVGNVYDQFDQATADMMMLPLLFDGRQQARMFAEDDIPAAMRREVEKMREANNAAAERQKGALEFQENVEERAEKFAEGKTDEAIVAGSVLGGIATGAAGGALLTSWLGPGAGVGALFGGGIGGLTAWVGGLLNRDELTEQAARAYEETRLASAEEGTAAGVSTGIQQWAGFSLQLTNPVTQLAHGLVELTGDNEIGDLKSAYYATDEKGDPTRPLWAKPLSLGAEVTDGVMKFISPINRALYTAQMASVIGGETATLATTGGKMFDPREGNFDNIFINDDGGFDPASGAAGILKIGIDVVQLGGLRGLATQTRRGREAVDSGKRIVNTAGFRFIMDESGKVTGKRMTMALLAPSEQVAAFNAYRKARVAVMKEGTGRAMRADDLYKAASDLASGSNRLKVALINGFGEGYEEVAQGILEPIALDGKIDVAENIVDPFLHGAAGGAGMSLGATFRAATGDDRMKMQAYVLETLRAGAEPDLNEFNARWEKATASERRVMAARSETDVQVTRQALERLAESQTASLIASPTDAAKAIDARRSAVERERNRGTVKTDQFMVMSGQLDARSTARAEVVEASALTVVTILENRLRGLHAQEQTLTRRVAELSASEQASDPVIAQELAEARQLIELIQLSRRVGENLTLDVAQIVEQIYRDDTDEDLAERLTFQMNRLLERFFDRTAPVAMPEGMSGISEQQLRDAGAYFTTVLHSREPKLDTGSYLGLLPQASWELTRTGSHNMLQVNIDVLQAINGDFDGDQLRAEHQLILTPERFEQTRAGLNFGGAGTEVDIATRNFDKQLTEAVGNSLSAGGDLQNEANAALDRIEQAITGRYGNLMSLSALTRVLDSFRTAVRAGSENARTTLLNALAQEAGEAITELGRRELNNEWLWISRQVHAAFQEFQLSYWKLRDRRADGPSPMTAPAAISTPEGTNRVKDAAVTDAQTLALFAAGNTLFRKFQKIHYTFYNAKVLEAANVEQADLYELAALYEELSRGITRPELERAELDDTISGRVMAMLTRLVDSAMQDPQLRQTLNPSTALTVLANVKVKNVWFEQGTPVTDGQDLSLAQVLLARALDAERQEYRLTFDTNVQLQAKHNRLRAMTRPGSIEAARAFLEVFKHVPFAESLGQSTGELAPHTTPEQWLRNYIRHDNQGRQDLERFYTNTPEYLDRKERSNLPYSLAEAARREVSPYRSMLDAMLAVGRSEQTFDPDTPVNRAEDAFGGRRADVFKATRDDLIEIHRLVTEALANYRAMTNRSRGERPVTVELVQEMFRANPVEGRALLEMIPDANANALFDFRDGELYVTPWLYEMFTIKDPREAVFFYWKNLTLAQWNSTQVMVLEDEGGVQGRVYGKIQSRFQRLLYQLAREPGRHHLEMLIRQMDQMKDLDEFFLWLNKTPGFRIRGEAPLLPFYDDVADYEADAGGGWNTGRASADLRDAIATMRRHAENLRDTVKFQNEREATDKTIRDGIRRALNNDPEATPTDFENLRKFEAVLRNSRELPRGFAPSAMLSLTQGALNGVDAHSHDKGVTADTYKGFGETQMLLDAFGFLPGLERVMESLTAHSLGSLTTNIGDLAKTSGTAMDAFGRTVKWEPLTVAEALDMLDDPRSAPLAYALLTPKALDVVNGKVSERLLTEASLKELLDQDHYRELFELDGSEPLNKAMRYLSLLDARTRAEGGHFEVLRYVNDLAIARTSRLGHEATPDDLARIRNQTYLDVAQALQLVGRVVVSPEMRQANTMKRLREAAVKHLKDAATARMLPGFTHEQTGTVVKAWVDSFLNDLEEEQLNAHIRLQEQYSGDELTRRLDTVDAQYDHARERIQSLLQSDLTGAIIERFRITGDPVQDRASRARIVEYAMSMTSAGRMPESAELWSQMAELHANGEIPGDDFDWETMSRSVMGVYLADEVIRVASHVSIPPFPKGDPAISNARFYQYFDPAYTFIATNLLDESKPLAAAAGWVHLMAEQPVGMVSIDEMASTLRKTVLNDKHLGTWTPGLMSQIVEAQTRMDSSGAGPAIGAPGNGPKRQDLIAYATRRTGHMVPGRDLLSTITFTADLVAEGADLFTELDLTPAGHIEPTVMPIAQLDNRFVASLRVNGTEIPLDQRNLGYQWAGESTPTGYRYIALPRLRRVLERIAAEQGARMADLDVEMEFFHPDSRPAGPDWLHNVYFDGMSHELLPDASESLLATLWSDNGGMISLDTQRLLDASKKGRRAIQPFARPDAAKVAAAEEKWTVGQDLAGMLRDKTEIVLSYDEGMGSVSPEYYNAVYKQLSLHHIVVGYRDGKPAAMMAEEVIAHQAANGRTAPLPLDDARLVQLSPDVLRTMLGEVGDQGVNRFFLDDYAINPEVRYTGITQQMLDLFADGWLGDNVRLSDTELANIGMQRTLTVRTMLTDAERNARLERIEYLKNRAADSRARRYAKLTGTHAQDSYQAILELAAGSVGTERNTFDFMALGVPIGPRNIEEAAHTNRLLAALKGVNDRNSFQRGWQVVDHGEHDWVSGRLTVESLDKDRDLEHQVVYGDIVLVDLKSFDRPERDETQIEDRIEVALRYLVNTGASIVLGSGNGRSDPRDFAARWLRSHGYTAVEGSKHLFGPVEFSRQSQNEMAYESTLTETGLIKPALNAVTFLLKDPAGFDENNAALNPDSIKLRDRKLVSNILPSSTYPNYNLLLDDNRDQSLYDNALAHLRSVSDPRNTEAREVLLEMGGDDPIGMMPLAQALDRFHARITSRSSLLPEVGDDIERGDILPFVHPDGRTVLYRHGFKLPRPEQLPDLQRRGGLNIALAPSEVDPNATSNTGRIVSVRNRTNFGRSLAIEVPLQPYGNKVQLEWNGMKYVVIPPNDDLRVYMQQPLFSNGTPVDLFSDLASANAKEAYDGRIINYRNALTFFQFDFTDDLVEFFFPDVKDRPAEAPALVYSMLHRLSRQTELKIPLPDAHALSKASRAIADLLTDFAEAERANGFDPDWLDRFGNQDTPSTLIAQAVITYLLTHGAHVDNVLRSAGFSHPDATTDAVNTRRVPGLFADLLDHGVDSPLHTELIKRFDAQLFERNGAGWKLHPDWTVEVFDGQGGSIEGYLQFGQAHSSGDNPALDAQAFNPNEKAAVSAHNAMAARLSLGARTAHRKLKDSLAFAKSFARGGGVAKLGPDGDNFWQMLTALPEKDETALVGWQRETPAETIRRALARDEIVGLYQPLNTEGWTQQQRDEYADIASKVLSRLNLYGSQIAMVDTWVRMHAGRPHAISEDGTELGVISGQDAIGFVKDIYRNLRDNLLPTAGANIPLMDVNHLTTIYTANLNRPDGQRWAPRTSTVKNSPLAASWDAWVEVAFGTAWIEPAGGGRDVVPEAQFDEMYRLAVDGLMHGYQGATTSTRYLPVSSDELRNRLLIDPDTNRMVVSTSADENVRATDATLFASDYAGLEEILGGQRIYAPGRNGPDPASAKGQQEARIERWRKEVDAPRQTRQLARGIRGPGQTFLGHTTTTSRLYRSMINLRAGNALFNVALMVSAPVEAFYRRTINTLANVATGESTGAVGQLQSRLADRFADTSIGAVAEALGVMPTYTAEQQRQLNDLIYALSTLPEFKAMVYQELMFQYPTMPGIGPIEKWLERYAKFGARMQDPAWGMLPKDLARIYVETALRRISTDPTGDNVYSVDRLITELPRNPEWLMDQDRETHNMAIAAIANIRSIKPNVLSLAFRGIFEPLSSNPRFLPNTAGNLIKMFTMFQNFWSNSFVNVTGLNAAAEFAAFWFDGRKKSKLIRRMQAAMRGQPFQPEEHEYYDMSEAIEGLDLGDAFIRGGITHTALFTLGMMAGSLGLSGEDDEERWRRLQAEEQGAGFVRDPRKLQNDFRSRDSIFLDWLPFGLDSLFRVDPDDPESRSMVQMNWTLRYFLSPIIGFERFYRSGDFQEVVHGFKDAFGAHPIINEQLWNAATDTVAELHAAANDAAVKGDAVGSANFLITAVGVLERMLLENSMINMIYIGSDIYDRDPFLQPKLDSDGNPQVDARGNPYQSDVLREFRDEETGEVRQGYVSRDPLGAQLRTFTENRFTLALITSLWSGLTGGSFTGSDTWRQNMPIKTRKIQLGEQDQDEIATQLLAAFMGAGGQQMLTEGEAAQIIKNFYQQRGEWWDAVEVEKMAKAMAERSGMAAMSFIDEAGREHLTTDGARAIFDGLRKGTVQLGDAALNGVYITPEQRNQIRDELAADLVQEGVDLGLTKEQATWRMRRIMFGTNAPAGAVKLIDLIYTDQIPWTDTLEYNQLNTSYIIGPDGMPWATGFTREGFFGALGLRPYNRAINPRDTGLAVDSRLNTVDNVAGINTGLRALEARPEGWEIPSIEDVIRDAADQVEAAIKDLDFSPSQPFQNKRGTGYGYRRRGGGYSYGGGGGYPNFTRMYALARRSTPYGNSVPFINTSNPLIRRANVRRERIWSERGRLKQWQ